MPTKDEGQKALERFLDTATDRERLIYEFGVLQERRRFAVYTGEPASALVDECAKYGKQLEQAGQGE